MAENGENLRPGSNTVVPIGGFVRRGS